VRSPATAILHLGDVDFDADGEGIASVRPSCEDTSLRLAMELLGCPLLAATLTNRTISARGRSSMYKVPT
jgi:myosin heavy subunit